ncbi:AMP-binding enzyme family protein [Anoxybacillus sp. B7M1]|jgi:long-chain acyl-CoA synthetase|uniref:Fatty acid--CoA ligase family protein n=1 Tax=Anoxybacteroides rupiense TaxID=311460 RepID=A0ABT5W4A5_9BACL|nr:MULTISPECIES: fatty acid--CoA ligase family protein [Anoxybacillus]ANB58310.1 AMP-binding enzyme family protein [Anoxybacillus sp. B2M1]ANB63585.1 AMP-binding enzyme family protein [Anoxybacillus sp. B7M1]MBB3907581.1 long-chain acyl-CoA synthetase [Anoxybacillus rupiensis]MBS2770568.1 fatty acid--CoA ligase family protein [Anoxybacillus rupiensis]MDE8564153.1 fatty acid--CoA ligase family protein [Anoxybacillus rupiensis]
MNLSWRLAEVAKQLPQKKAYVFEGESCTYQELHERISRFASGLASMGVGKGDHIALLLGNSPYFIIGLYGALRTGATVIPVNPIYTPDEIGYILTNGDVKAVIGLDLLVPLFQKMEARLPNIEHVIVCDTPQGKDQPISFTGKMKSFTDVLKAGVADYQGPQLAEDDTAVILYTSGTTGKPKGAMLTHKNLYSNAQDTANYLKINESDRVIATLPMFHVFCLTVALNAPLMNGGTVLIVPKFSPAKIFQLAREEKATIFAGVPTMYNFLYQYEHGKAEDFQTLRLCISGGASMPVALLKNFEQKFKVIVSEGYGLSEASPVTCFNPLDRPRKPGSIGCSILHVENKVVNEFGEEVPVGEVGELIVRGPNVMKGYYKMPEETAHALRNGWLYTGDLAKMDEEGYFYIVDRKKDMIIVGGYNVYPREVEEVLYSHPDIVEAAVIGIPDPDFGEAVKCFVVSKNADLTEEQLIEYCREHLAKYKVPSMVEFLDEIPKNTTGKILRRALKEQLTSR